MKFYIFIEFWISVIPSATFSFIKLLFITEKVEKLQKFYIIYPIPNAWFFYFA